VAFGRAGGARHDDMRQATDCRRLSATVGATRSCDCDRPLASVVRCALARNERHVTDEPDSRVVAVRLVADCSWIFAPPRTPFGWRRGVVVSGVRSMNEVNTRRTRLVPGRVTVFERVYHLGMQQAN